PARDHRRLPRLAPERQRGARGRGRDARHRLVLSRRRFRSRARVRLGDGLAGPAVRPVVRALMREPRVLIGLRAHSGLAAAVRLGGSARAPVVLERRRLELADEKTPRPVQPYHASEKKPLREAETIVSRARAEADLFAAKNLAALVTDLFAKGHRVTACA